MSIQVRYRSLRSLARRAALIACAFGLISTAAGCARNAPPSDAAASGNLQAFARLFSGFHADYDPAESPRDLANRSDLVVVGQLGPVSEGQTFGEPDQPWTYQTVIVTVTVDEVKKGALPENSDGKVYVQLIAPATASASDYNDVAPRDSDILWFLSAAAIDTTDADAGPERGQPDGQPLWQSTTPQGFLIQADDGVLQIQESQTYDDVTLDSFYPDRATFPKERSHR